MSNNNSFPENTRIPLRVTPLNSVPYIGPSTHASMSSSNNSFPENTRHPLQVTPLNSVPYIGPETHASMSSNNSFPENRRHPLQVTPLNSVPYIAPETHASMSSNNSFLKNTRHPLQVTPLNSVPYIAPETHASMSSNNSFPENTRNPLQVPPLNSVPYIAPETHASMSSNRTNENAGNVGRPAMIFLPFQSTQEVPNVFTQTNTGIGLTGSAAMRRFGPSVGMVDIAESDDSYYFRVALPGVSKEESKLSCEIKNSGKVLIMGVTTTGERIVRIHNQVFNMLTQNFCPQGPFTISFQLPGPVNNQEFKGNFGTDGVLEGIVKKRY